VYIFFIKVCPLQLKMLFFNMFISTMILFYFSSYYSAMDWISAYHVTCHFIFHIFIGAGCLIAFL
jgi:hypothetical protein